MERQTFKERIMDIYDALPSEEQDRFIAMIEREVSRLLKEELTSQGDS